MRLGTKTHYSTRVMVDLALNCKTEARVVSAQDIAARQQVSPKYLKHLMEILESTMLEAPAHRARA